MKDVLKAIGDPTQMSLRQIDKARLKAQLDGVEMPTRRQRLKDAVRNVPNRTKKGVARVGYWYMSNVPSLDQQYAQVALNKIRGQARRRA